MHPMAVFDYVSGLVRAACKDPGRVSRCTIVPGLVLVKADVAAGTRWASNSGAALSKGMRLFKLQTARKRALHATVAERREAGEKPYTLNSLRVGRTETQRQELPSIFSLRKGTTVKLLPAYVLYTDGRRGYMRPGDGFSVLPLLNYARSALEADLVVLENDIDMDSDWGSIAFVPHLACHWT